MRQPSEPILLDRGAVASDAEALVNALADPLLEIGRDGSVRFANPAAEQFFGMSASTLCKRKLVDLLPDDSPVFSLIDQVFTAGHDVSEFGVNIETPRIGSHVANLNVAPIAGRRQRGGVGPERSITRPSDRPATGAQECGPVGHGNGRIAGP